MKFILGKKIGMSQIFNQEGQLVPVTLIEAGPCKLLQKKSLETDGYRAVQLGFLTHIKEFPISGDYPEEETLNVSLFEKGDKVTVSGVSKGKGFQGGVKRWGFAGASASHGVKHNKRKIGSIGSAFPQRVIKGRRMPGRMGSERITVKGLEVVEVNPDKNMMAVKGAIPGRRGSLLEIRG